MRGGKKTFNRRKVSKIAVDLSDWEFGEWPEELEAIRGKFILIPAETFREVASKIATEAIDAFLNEDAPFAVEISADGIEVCRGEMRGMVTVPWPNILVGEGDVKAKFLEWLTGRVI